jgi:hypothetical protein
MTRQPNERGRPPRDDECRATPSPTNVQQVDTHTNAYEFTAAPHEPVTAEDRREAAILAEAAELGYRLAVQCRCCGSWLVADRSVREFIGPVCRARAVD